MYLYRIVHRESAKSYIGITTKTVESRVSEHCAAARNRPKYAIHKAIRKYGLKSFDIEIILETNDWDLLKAMERIAIADFNSFGDGGYNLTDGGEGVLGHVHSPETIIKMSVSAKRRGPHAACHQPRTADTKLKLSAAFKKQCEDRGHPRTGTVMTTSQRAKLRKAYELMQMENRHPRDGCHHSEETRAKMREAWVRRKLRKELDKSA